jgi:hypothetical protein
MQLEIPWLRAVVERMRERLRPSVAHLRDHLLKSPVFGKEKGPILERGLAAYLDGEATVAAPMLIPRSKMHCATFCASRAVRRTSSSGWVG